MDAGVIQRPRKSLARGAAFISFLPPMREGSAGQAQRLGLAPLRGAACRVTGRSAPRRPTAAIFDEATGLVSSDPRTSPSRYPGSIGAALHPTLSKPLKAAPSSGAAGDLAPWDGGTNPACRRHTLLCQLSVPRRHPQPSKAWPV